MRAATRPTILAALLLAIALPVAAQAPGSKPGPAARRPKPTRAAPIALAPGDPAPRIGGLTLAGEEYDGDWAAHRLTLVNFWGVFCVPCKTEMPVLEKLYRAKRQDGLQVVGLEVHRSSVDATKAFVKAVDVTYPIVAIDGERIVDWGGVSIYPTSFLVGGDGRLIRKYVGATQAELEGLLADVDAILAGKPLGTRMPADEPQGVPAPR